MADASKRIDLAAPLLSVRRHGGLRLRYGERCDDDATLGGVPFGWERRPGRPKSVCATQRDPALPESDHEAAGRLSDALSRADSCYTVNCSVAGLSEAAGTPASACAAPGARGSVMMDRFLLAAKEQCVFRKAGTAAANTRAPSGDSLPRRLPVQHLPAAASHVLSNNVKETNDNEDDDDEWEAHSTAGFASKRRCALLPTRCAKSALLLLGPVRSMARRRHRGGRRFLSDYGSARRETNPLLPRPLNGQHPEVHDAGMRTWEDVYINSLLRSDRVCSLRRQAAMASELDRTVRGLYTGQAGAAVRPKATHLGMLLVLGRADGEAASPLPPPRRGRLPTPKTNVGGKTPRRLNAVGLSPLSQEKTAASRGNTVLALPSPKTPSESWLSRTLPTVSSRPPATSFLGIHVQQIRKQRASSSWCSSGQANVVDHGGARARQTRICDLQK